MPASGAHRTQPAQDAVPPATVHSERSQPVTKHRTQNDVMLWQQWHSNNMLPTLR